MDSLPQNTSHDNQSSLNPSRRKQNATEKAYRLAHREQIHLYALRYREKHRQEARDYAKEYSRKYPEKVKGYKPDPEKARKKFRKHYYADHEKSLVRSKARDAKRRASKTQAGGKYAPQEWKDLKTKYDYTCLCCGKREPDIKLTADHVIPISRGGSSYIDNIQPLCKPCNSKKYNTTIDYRDTSKSKSENLVIVQLHLPFL